MTNGKRSVLRGLVLPVRQFSPNQNGLNPSHQIRGDKTLEELL